MNLPPWWKSCYSVHSIYMNFWQCNILGGAGEEHESVHYKYVKVFFLKAVRNASSLVCGCCMFLSASILVEVP